MIFKRIETRRVVASERILKTSTDIISLLRIIQSKSLHFCIKFGGACFTGCQVLNINDQTGKIRMFGRSPGKVTFEVEADANGIESIEVESNADFMAEETDEEGRMSRLLGGAADQK